MNRGLLTGLLSTTSHPTKLCENLGVLLDAEKFISLGEEIYARNLEFSISDRARIVVLILNLEIGNFRTSYPRDFH